MNDAFAKHHKTRIGAMRREVQLYDRDPVRYCQIQIEVLKVDRLAAAIADNAAKQGVKL